MQQIDTVIIGGGQAGLAMSRSLDERGIEHVVLERGRIGERWRSERWDSLHLLTPRWLSRLSGWEDEGTDAAGFMTSRELVRYLEAFESSLRAPVLCGVTVTRVQARDGGYRVETDRGDWSAAHVVIATGQSQHALVPTFASDLPSDVHQVVPTRYRNPDALPDGGVVVVGASATGIQLAEEIHASGRPVTLSVSRHTRLPRAYRGRDILWWFDRMGILDQRVESVRDIEASRDQPSMQLIGSSDHRTLDLERLSANGVDVVGRTQGVANGHLYLEDDLAETTAAADFKLARLRTRIDAYIRDRGLSAEVGEEESFTPVRLPQAPTQIDLRSRGVRSVLWATGFGRSYPWLQVPVVDARGEILHVGGVTASPGLYVLGLNFMRRRSSSFIAGVGKDAAEIAEHLDRRRRDASAPEPIATGAGASSPQQWAVA